MDMGSYTVMIQTAAVMDKQQKSLSLSEKKYFVMSNCSFYHAAMLSSLF